MKVVTGKVVDGKVEVEPALDDGTLVAVLAPGDTGFHLDEQEQAELAAALAEIRAGDFVDGAELIRELKALSRR